MHCFRSFEIIPIRSLKCATNISVFILGFVDNTNDYLIMHNCLNKERFILTCDRIHYKIISYFEASSVSYT